MIAALTLGQLIKATNPGRPIIDLRDYSNINPMDFEDRPLEDDDKPLPRALKPRGAYKPRTLTAKQVACIRLWCAGYTYREIAARVGMSSGTVRNKLSRIKKYLGCNKRGHVIASLQSRGIDVPAPVRITMDSICGLHETVLDVLVSGAELAFKVPADDHFHQIEKWAHTYAQRAGGRISCRHVDGTVWIFRRTA